ncbi:MAG: 4Fe-4S dicluster domain-containing protein [Reinekea sp.]|jgi:sulfhydrogenase subunit beta (sulfur reductase)
MSRSGYLTREKFPALLNTLQMDGYSCVGPNVRDGAISFDKIQSVDALPQGVEVDMKPGEVRLRQEDHRRYFAWPNGPQSVKPWLYRSRELLWSARQTDEGFVFSEPQIEAEPIAYIGARACDLAAIKLQDQHFIQCEYPDPYYSAHRKALFIVAINCSHAASTCFCASTGDGPEISGGYDLLLDELDDGYQVHFGTEKGLSIFEQLPLQSVTEAQEKQAQAQLEAVASGQERKLLQEDMYSNIFANLDNDEWDKIAETCLACGNCTSVCPTCFCHREVESAALDGQSSAHYREWDSCFNQDHSYIHGFTVRKSIQLRYRQWMSHKLGTWRKQYGRSGCTGCGRCIAWCPVGIDFVAESDQIAGNF